MYININVNDLGSENESLRLEKFSDINLRLKKFHRDLKRFSGEFQDDQDKKYFVKNVDPEL